MEHITGEYVFFLDSDDYIREDALEKLYNNAKNNDSDLVFLKIARFTNDNEFNYNLKIIKHNLTNETLVVKDHYDFYKILENKTELKIIEDIFKSQLNYCIIIYWGLIILISVVLVVIIFSIFSVVWIS